MMNTAESEDDHDVYRLEGTVGTQTGGLVIMKKGPAAESNQHEFKRPVAKPSILGLDKLAASKRLQASSSQDANSVSGGNESKGHGHNERHYRDRNDETPSHTGGVSDAYLKKIKDRREWDRGVYASSKDDDYRRQQEDARLRQDRKQDRKRHSEADWDDVRSRSHRSSRSYREWEETPKRFRDEPSTPKLGSKDTPSRSSWDDDDHVPAKRSSWDLPTPSPSREGRDRESSRRSSSREPFRKPSSSRSRDSGISSSKSSKSSPLPTPAYRYNEWMDNKKSIKYTPKVNSKETEDDRKDSYQLVPDEDWDEEQKRLDRQWYSMDEGYDESQNPFAGVSEEYTQRKKKKVPTATLR